MIGRSEDEAWGEPNGGSYELNGVEDFSGTVGGGGRACTRERKARGCHVEEKSVGERA